jgi:hypothetical protein
MGRGAVMLLKPRRDERPDGRVPSTDAAVAVLALSRFAADVFPAFPVLGVNAQTGNMAHIEAGRPGQACCQPVAQRFGAGQARAATGVARRTGGLGQPANAPPGHEPPWGGS